jgi:hypothetical protein
MGQAAEGRAVSDRLAGPINLRMQENSEVTRLLCMMRSRDPDAAARLLPIVYQELRRVAASIMRRERPGHTPWFMRHTSA